MKNKKPAKKHVKMYADEKTLQKVKEAAESEGISQSTWLLLKAKEGLK